MKTAIIVNRLKLKLVAPLIDDLKAFKEIAIFYTEQKRDGERLAKKAIEQSYHKIISVGGDGTHSEVVNAAMGFKNEILENIAIGFFPAGTGNDFCRMIQVCSIEELIQMKPSHKIDLLRADYMDEQDRQQTRMCLNMAEFGALAEVVKNYNASLGHSRRVGKGPYIKSFLKVLTHLTSSPIKMKYGDEPETYVDMTNVVIANGTFFGGGIGIAPSACINDGQFNVTLLKKMGRLGLALTLTKAMCGRTFLKPEAFRQSTSMQASPANPLDKIPFEVDGEWLGYLPVEIKMIPQAISILNPIMMR